MSSPMASVGQFSVLLWKYVVTYYCSRQKSISAVSDSAVGLIPLHQSLLVVAVRVE